MTPREYAAHAGVHYRTVYTWMALGMPHRKSSARKSADVAINEKAADAWRAKRAKK